MSMPQIPDLADTTIDRASAVNLLIASIAMEELALAHILNAEGEKLQYVLGTLEGVDPGEITVCDLLEVNQSVRQTIKEILKTEMMLQFKLENAIDLDENGVDA